MDYGKQDYKIYYGLWQKTVEKQMPSSFRGSSFLLEYTIHNFLMCTAE